MRPERRLRGGQQLDVFDTRASSAVAAAAVGRTKKKRGTPTGPTARVVKTRLLLPAIPASAATTTAATAATIAAPATTTESSTATTAAAARTA